MADPDRPDHRAHPGCTCGRVCSVTGACGRQELRTPMEPTVEDLMVPSVIVGDETHTVGETRELMDQNGIHALPVVNEEGEPVGIVTSTDVLGDVPPDMPLAEIMSEKVHTVPRHEAVGIAAGVMRRHKLHHVVVTEEKKVVGILSSFDMLELVENKRFTMKDAPIKSGQAVQ